MKFKLTYEVEPTHEQLLKVWEHVKDIYENDIENIKHDMQYDIVSGGCLLVYNADIEKFLNEIDIFVPIELAFEVYDNIVYEALYMYCD